MAPDPVREGAGHHTRALPGDLVPRTKPSCFMGQGHPPRGRHNCPEKAQPTETDHQPARRMETGLLHRQWPGRLGPLPPAAEGGLTSASCDSRSTIGIERRVVTEAIAFSLLIHAGLMLERCRLFPPALGNRMELKSQDTPLWLFLERQNRFPCFRFGSRLATKASRRAASFSGV